MKIFKKKLYIFDMDGTLLPGTTASLEIARITKQLEQLHELELLFSQGLLQPGEFASKVHLLWGILESEVLDLAFSQAPKLKNIEKTLTTIKEQGGMSCLITLSPDFFANRFYHYGFDYIFASSFPLVHSEPLLVEKILTPQDKLKICYELLYSYKISIDDCIAFGDSMSDYPLFQKLNSTVAVNGTDSINKFLNIFMTEKIY